MIKFCRDCDIDDPDDFLQDAIAPKVREIFDEEYKTVHRSIEMGLAWRIEDYLWERDLGSAKDD